MGLKLSSQINPYNKNSTIVEYLQYLNGGGEIRTLATDCSVLRV